MAEVRTIKEEIKLDSIEKNHLKLRPEEFPEGPYGAATNEERLGKSTPWKPGQRRSSAFTYENLDFHEDLERLYPGSHPLHDDPDK